MTATATATRAASDIEGIPGLPPRNAEEAAAARALPPVPVPAAAPVTAFAAPGVVRIKETPEPEPEDREPLFVIEHEDGTETVWTIPVVAPEYIWVNALAISATSGAGVAEVYMMQTMLGPAGWKALLASKAMKKGHYVRMVTIVRNKVMGPQERDPNR